MPSTEFFTYAGNISFSIAALSDGLDALSAATTTSNATLATNVQALTAAVDLLPQKLALVVREIVGETEPISLDDVDNRCIEDAFTFMRTLNEVESLVTDSKFNEKGKAKNNDTLKGYLRTSLHQNCIDILRTKLDITQAEQEALIHDFEALFEPMVFDSKTNDLGDRAARLAALHSFRDRILHLFAEQCRADQPGEPSIEPAGTSTPSVAKGNVASS